MSKKGSNTMKSTTEILKKALALAMAVIMTVGSCGCGTTYYASEEAQGEYEINALAEPTEETVALNFEEEETDAAPEKEASSQSAPSRPPPSASP